MSDELTRLEAIAQPVVAEYLIGSWRSARAGAAHAAPPPDVLRDRAALAWLEQRRAADRRAEMLWRWHAFAAVEGDAAVMAAVSAWVHEPGPARVAAVIAARVDAARAIGWDCWALHLARMGLDEDVVAACAAAPERDHGPEPAASWWQVRAALDAMGARTGRVAIHEGGEGQAGGVSRTYPVDPPRDVRIVAEHPRDLPHEIGHALYAAGVDEALPWSMRAAASRAADEAVARFFERLGRAPRPGRRARQTARVDAARAAYADPDGAHGALDHWVVLDPGAHAAYLVAQVVAEQMWQRAAAMPVAERGPWLREAIFRRGASAPWRAIFADAGVAL